MKKITIKLMAAIALLFTTAAATMAQGSFAYQAVIRTADGKVVSNQKVGMRFTLLSEGTAYYSEVQTPTTNEYGNISVMIGSGTKESGDFMNVPWSSMNIMLKIEVDAKGGTNYIELGQTQLLSVPYAMYAQSAGKIEATQKTSSATEPIFEVKDKDGNLVFAVFPDGVKVYVDDTDAAKAKRSGFVVTGRSATKEGENADYFAVNAEGTQVYVDDEASDKAKRSGFVVTGRSATKDGESADYLAVNGKGTQVYVDDPTEDKAKRSGFVVTGRTATKDASAEVFKIDGAGTQVFIDDTPDADKAKRSGFVVTGRSATKDADAADYFAVSGNGTQVYVDTDVTPDKAKRSGFVVTGRSATKGEDLDVFVVDGQGTQVFIDDEDESKAKRSGFVVTGRSATKDTPNDYFKVTSNAVNVSISSFSVSDKNTAENVFAITQGNVQVNSDLLMSGEVGKVVEAQALDTSVFTIALVDNNTVIVLADMIDPDRALVDNEDEGSYALLRITDNSFVPVNEWDSLMFDARGYVTTNKKNAVVSVRCSYNGEIVVNPLQKNLKGFAAVFGLTWTRGEEMLDSYQFKTIMVVSDIADNQQGEIHEIDEKPHPIDDTTSYVNPYGSYYGAEKGHIIYNMVNGGETIKYDYYFSNYGKIEYYLVETTNASKSTTEKAITYVDRDSLISVMYVLYNNVWYLTENVNETDYPIFAFGNEDLDMFTEITDDTVNGLAMKKYAAEEGTLYVYQGVIMQMETNDEATFSFESADFRSDVKTFYNWVNDNGYTLGGSIEEILGD